MSPRRRNRPSARVDAQPTTPGPAYPGEGTPRSEGAPLLPFARVGVDSSRVKYVRFRDGQIIFVDPLSHATHLQAARFARGMDDDRLTRPRSTLSAGTVHVDRAGRSVRMVEPFSHSLRVEADQDDVHVIHALLFGPTAPPALIDPLDGTGPALEVPHGR